MFQVFVVVATFFGSKIIAALSNRRLKAILIPFSLFYKYVVLLTIGTFGGIVHFASAAFGFVIVMIGCNGFPMQQMRHNPVLKSFLVFYAYMILAALWGYHPVAGICDYLSVLMTYLSGYFIAAWALRTENGLKKVCTAVMLSAAIVILWTISKGGFSAAALDESGRATMDVGVDVESRANVNWVALQLDCFMPFLSAFLFSPLIRRKSVGLTALFVLVLLGISLLLIRTGSRNGCLVLLPCGWYALKAGGNAIQRHRRIVAVIAVCVIGAFAVAYSMRNAEVIRSFDFSGEHAKGYETKMDAITSGRWSYYESLLNQMSLRDKIFGKGFSLEKQDYVYDRRTKIYEKVTRVRSLNYHSMYMTFFIRSGMVGTLMLMIFLITAIRCGFRTGDRGRMALLFLGSWMLPGVGEAAPIENGLTVCAGFAMAMLTQEPLLLEDKRGRVRRM